MTAIGLDVLNIFSQCMRDNEFLQRKKLSEREIYVISKLYEWKAPVPDVEKLLASELKIGTERIRQISIKALKKMRRPLVSDPIAAIKSIIDSYAQAAEKDDPLKTIVRLCLFEMEELPTMKMVKLLVCLCAPFKDKFGSMMEYCKTQKDLLKREFLALQRSEIKKSNQTERFTNFLNNHIIWFDEVKTYKKEHFEHKKPKRTVTSDLRYKSGIFYSNKSNRAVQYESGVELSFINQLESSDDVVYYFEQPVTINYSKNQTEYVYTPDFAVLLSNGKCFLAETKGSLDALMDARLHREIEALIDYCKEHGLGILLNCELRSFDSLSNYPINTTLEKIFQDKLNEKGGRTIFRNEFNEILEMTGARKIEALALILKNNWGYYPYPFKLSPRNPYQVFRATLINKFLK